MCWHKTKKHNLYFTSNITTFPICSYDQVSNKDLKTNPFRFVYVVESFCTIYNIKLIGSWHYCSMWDNVFGHEWSKSQFMYVLPQMSLQMFISHSIEMFHLSHSSLLSPHIEVKPFPTYISLFVIICTNDWSIHY